MNFNEKDIKDTTISLNDLNLVQFLNSNITTSINGIPQVQGIKGDLINAIGKFGWDDNIFSSFTSEYRSSKDIWLEVLNFYNLWKDGEQFTSSKWKYNNIIFDLDQFEIDNMLFENGSFAVVRFLGELFPVKYMVLEKETLTNKPLKIKVSQNDSLLNDKEFTFKDFVIWKNDPHSRTSISKSIYLIIRMIETINELHRQLGLGYNKYLINTSKATLTGTKNNDTKDAYNSILESKDIAHTIESKPFNSKDGQGKDPTKIEGENIDYIYSLEPKQRIQELIELYLFYRDLTFESFGSVPNSMNKKAERVNSAEITSQQDLALGLIKTMFKQREINIERTNKTFLTTMSIEWDKDNVEIQKDIENEREGINNE